MSEKEFDYIVFIGRLQPYHLGHQSILIKAQVLAKKRVIVLIGSSYSPRNIKNPFSFEERKSMLKNDEYLGGLHSIDVKPLHDYKYNDLQWITEVQEKVNEAIRDTDCSWSDYPPTIGIIGLDKDTSTEYLKWFPQWKSIEADQFGDGNRFDATAIRDLLFGGHDLRFTKGVLPNSSWNIIKKMQNTAEWSNLQEEYTFIKTYKKSWESAPYAPTFVTVDAVVFQDGHVLLIKRGAMPGKGLWALPGGFINQNEKIKDATIRELREETGLKVPEPVLRGSIVSNQVFDNPDRSLRGRTITHATAFKLASVGKLPTVKGGDDAAKAKWVSLSDLRDEDMFEDHMDIIVHFMGAI